MLDRLDEGSHGVGQRQRLSYVAPAIIESISLYELLRVADRPVDSAQLSLLSEASNPDRTIFYSGDLSLVSRRSVSVIGARDASSAGILRATKIARQLSEAGIVVTSGLAAGIDSAAHKAAIEANGRTVAVIGTPIDRAYPNENSHLQSLIAERHLLISQFRLGQRTYKSDFPKRNRLMAALTDASVIVEASDSSGTLHQAAECVRLKRWLFIMRSVVEDPALSWPSRFLHEKKVAVLTTVEDILSRLEG